MHIWTRLVVGFTTLVILATSCTGIAASPTATLQPTVEPMSAMGGMEPPTSTDDHAPLVRGFYEGGEVLFTHTEASDPDVAKMLTEMMGGPQVVLVPELAEAPESLLANVYVFTNGIVGQGPFGFQPDVFDAIPGDKGYRPLRAVNLVSWNEGANVRELHSIGEVKAAEAEGELAVERHGIVVNMPILVWPGGTR